jgi:tripartite-type tricarboxylate transporter receptor subunit TctC
MKIPSWRLAAVLGALVFAAHMPTAGAVEDDGFYRGKQITFIVGSGPGGGYDVYARAFAPFLGEHIPGKPKIVVSNMVGASSLRAATYMGNTAPRDGSVIAITLSSIPTAPQLTPTGANFDPATFSWVGSMTKDPFVGYVWHTSPIKSVADAFNREVTMGADSLGSAGADMAVIAKTFFGMKLKLVLGYPDSNSVKLAMEKGEVEGTFANFYADIKSTRPEWVRNGLIRFVVQHGKTRSKDLPDVPSIFEFAKTDEHRIALNLLLARQEFAKPVFAPPGVPPARLEMLRRAFDETLKDPAFLEIAARTGIPIEEPMTGEELTAAVLEVAKTPPEVGAHVRQIFENYK